jgi:hypothetical protein
LRMDTAGQELLADDGVAIRALLEAKRSSVVLMLVRACARHSIQQKDMLRAIARALDALAPPASLGERARAREIERETETATPPRMIAPWSCCPPPR